MSVRVLTGGYLVPTLWSGIVFGIGMALALSLCFAMGLRSMLGVLLGLLAFFLPAVFSAGILLRKLWPPKLAVYRDRNSILS
jgi:hypothetical protein